MHPHNASQRPPACEKCERKMTPLGELPPVGNRMAIRVCKCNPCQRIGTMPVGGVKLNPETPRLRSHERRGLNGPVQSQTH